MPEHREGLRELTLSDALKLAVALARATFDLTAEPAPGDLVVEHTWMHTPDPDGIGWLVGHDRAPYESACPKCGNPFDGSDSSLRDLLSQGRDMGQCCSCGSPVEMRDVWDVRPLSGAKGINGSDVQRWENAEFRKVPDHVLVRMGWRSA